MKSERDDGPEGYSHFGTTADAGVEARGETLEELFVHAAEGMLAYLAEAGQFQPVDTKQLHVTSENREELLVAWLSEINYLVQAEDFFPCRLNLTELTDGEIRAEVQGETVDRGRHRILTEVKAVTYHDLSIWEDGDEFHARVIFDF